MQYNNIYKPLRGGLLFVAILIPGFPACLRISWKPDEVLLRAGLSLDHPFNNHPVLMIADIFTFGRKEKIDPVFVKLCNLSTYHF